MPHWQPHICHSHARPCSTPVLQGPCNFHLWAKPPTDEHKCLQGKGTHLSAMKTESTTDSCLGMRWYVMHVVRPPADTTSALRQLHLPARSNARTSDQRDPDCGVGLKCWLIPTLWQNR